MAVGGNQRRAIFARMALALAATGSDPRVPQNRTSMIVRPPLGYRPVSTESLIWNSLS
jgi:hypothetical protein